MELIKDTMDRFITEDKTINKGEFMKVAAGANKDYDEPFGSEKSRVIKVFTFNGQAIDVKAFTKGNNDEQYIHNLAEETKGEEEVNRKCLEINYTNLKQIFQVMNELAGEGQIKWKYDYDAIIDKKATYILRINIKALYSKLLKKCKEKGIKTPFYEDRPFDFARVLQNENYYLGSFNTRFLRQDNSERKFVSTSAVHIDVAALQTMGVEVGAMLVDNRRRFC
ncbi:hypothetical protein [Clostridium sp.]|uniref:hypothetical protein n=1 Tax=Clostridium sp. TaxID=1506 RepID=UPI002FC72E51